MTNKHKVFVHRTIQFAKAIVRLAKSGKDLLPEEQILARFEICKGCEYFTGLKCTQCGCCTNTRAGLLNKLAYATEACPEGKWGEVDDTPKTATTNATHNDQP